MVTHEFRDDATNSIWIYRGQTSLPVEGAPRRPAGAAHERGPRGGRRRSTASTTSAGASTLVGAVGPLRRQGRRLRRARDASRPPGPREDEDGERTLPQRSRHRGSAEGRGHRRPGARVPVRRRRRPDRAVGRTCRASPSWSSGCSTTTAAPTSRSSSTSRSRRRSARTAAGTRSTRSCSRSATRRVDGVEADRRRACGRCWPSASTSIRADQKALRVRNNLEDFVRRACTILGYLRIFVWIVGIGTMTAGVVGDVEHHVGRRSPSARGRSGSARRSAPRRRAS